MYIGPLLLIFWQQLFHEATYEYKERQQGIVSNYKEKI